jgi:hypothetical protein
LFPVFSIFIALCFHFSVFLPDCFPTLFCFYFSTRFFSLYFYYYFCFPLFC